MIFPPKRQYLPGSLAAKCGYVTKVWLLNWKCKCSELLWGSTLKRVSQTRRGVLLPSLFLFYAWRTIWWLEGHYGLRAKKQRTRKSLGFWWHWKPLCEPQIARGRTFFFYGRNNYCMFKPLKSSLCHWQRNVIPNWSNKLLFSIVRKNIMEYHEYNTYSSSFLISALHYAAFCFALFLIDSIKTTTTKSRFIF